MSGVHQFGSSVKLEQMETELSAQLQDLRTEIEHNEILQKSSSKPYRWDSHIIQEVIEKRYW